MEIGAYLPPNATSLPQSQKANMTLSVYDVTVPVFLRAFDNLQAILDKGIAFAESEGIDPNSLVETRLFADMAPLSGQIQRASDTAKLCAARLTGVTPPSFPDEETTFAELKARIEKTVAFLKSVPPEAFEGAETRTVTLKTRTSETHFEGKDYVLKHALPNFFFHVTTAYAILRHKGVPIGKKDYLGAF